MAYKVLIPEEIAPEGKEYLREKGYEIKMGSGLTEDDIVRDVADCDAILIRNQPLTRRIIDAAPKLKVVGRHGVGVDALDIPYATEKGIWITNAPLSNYKAVAEHTLFLMLACAKYIHVVDREFHAGNFEIRNSLMTIELEGKTLGLLGLGRIGRSVAEKARVFGMNIVGYDPYLPQELVPSYVKRLSTKEEVLREADFVSLHMPSTAENRHLIGEKELSLMKPTAFLINTARGGIVEEGALTQALKAGIIAGCALDVFEQEPPDTTAELFQLENAILTPHNAAHTWESTARMGLHAAQGIHEVLSGQEPTWPVNHPKK